ncbi:MAG TPA: DUF6612 family protein [Bacillales bacterium]
MKTLKLMIIAMLTIGLTACGMSQQTAKEIMTQAAKSADQINSMAMDMELEQDIKTNGKKIHTTTSMKAQMTKEPLAMHASFNIKAKNQALDSEMYMTDKGMFMKMPSPAGERWVKFPDKMFDQIMKMPRQQTDPLKQLKEMKKYADDFSLEVKDGKYILKLSAGGEKFLEYVKERMQKAMPKKAEMEALKNLKLNKIKYTFVLDKETYQPESMKMNMDMSFSQNGKTINLVQNASGSYSKYNQIEEITVPKKVVENAKSIPGMGQQ